MSNIAKGALVVYIGEDTRYANSHWVLLPNGQRESMWSGHLEVVCMQVGDLFRYTDTYDIHKIGVGLQSGLSSLAYQNGARLLSRPCRRKRSNMSYHSTTYRRSNANR